MNFILLQPTQFVVTGQGFCFNKEVFNSKTIYILRKSDRIEKNTALHWEAGGWVVGVEAIP